jgi:hypothetical protein
VAGGVDLSASVKITAVLGSGFEAEELGWSTGCLLVRGVIGGGVDSGSVVARTSLGSRLMAARQLRAGAVIGL